MIGLVTASLLVVSTAQGLPQEPGLHGVTLGELRFSLSIPDDYAADEKHPLVIALHYGGRVTPFFGRGILTGLAEPGLRELSPIIAAPDSPGDGWANPRSEAAVLSLLDQLIEAYPVDPDRILLTGYSLGGMGTWYIASRNPERFTAAIPMAGSPRELGDRGLGAFENLPLYAIHGREDTVVPIDPTREAIEELRQIPGSQVELEVVEGITHYEVPAFAPYLRQAASWLADVWATPTKQR